MATTLAPRVRTKVSHVDYQLTVADEFITQSIRTMRVAAGMDAKVGSALSALEDLLLAMVYQARSLNAPKVKALLALAKEKIEEAYDTVQDMVDALLQGVSVAEGRIAINAVAKALDNVTGLPGVAVDLTKGSAPSEALLKTLARDTLISGAPSSAWWRRHAGDTQFRFAQVVRQGMVNGDTTAKIAARIAGTPAQPGVMDISKASARKLVQQSVQAVAAASRMEAFRNIAHLAHGVEQVSTLDNKTSEICIAYSGGQWDFDGNPINGTTLPFRNPGGAAEGIPRHWNCRSMWVPVMKTFREIGVDLDEPDDGFRASMDGPVSSNITFDAWLKTKPEGFVNELLGRGRADLWRRGVITLQQLLDQRGNPMTLDQLRKRYAQ